MEGAAIFWYDNGNVWKEGSYLNNYKEGKWLEYDYDTGNKSSEGNYKSNRKSGGWNFFSNDGKLEKTCTYVNGNLEGYFVKYDSLSNVINEAVYSNNISVQESSPDSLIELLPYYGNCNERNLISSGMNKLYEYISKNLKYPTDAKEYGIEGEALVRFTISENGQIQEIE